MARKQDLRKFRLPAIILALIFGITFFVVKDNITNAALAPVSADNWDLGVQIQSTSYNNNALGDYAEWIIGADELSVSEESEHVTVKMLISYRYHDDTRGYAPGELRINITNPFKAYSSFFNKRVLVTTAVGANSHGITSHKWNDISSTISNTPLGLGNGYSSDFTITNKEPFEAGANTEGSVEITFDLISYPLEKAPAFDDESSSIIDSTITATLNGTITSQPVRMYYQRDYSHMWQKDTYSISDTIDKVGTTSNLAANPEDYYWVLIGPTIRPARLSNSCVEYNESIMGGHPTLGLTQRELRLIVDDDAVVYSQEGVQIQPIHDSAGDYYLAPIALSSNLTCEDSNRVQYYGAIIGYPKANHRLEDGTLSTTIREEAWGTYKTYDDKELLAERESQIVLSNYNFIYDGRAVAVKKITFSDGSSSIGHTTVQTRLNSAAIKAGDASVRYEVNGTLKSVDGPTNLRIGDDVLFYKDNSSGETHRLTDSDYHFRYVVGHKSSSMRTLNNGFIEQNEYSMKLYVRRRNKQNYELYKEYSRFYFGINDIDEEIAASVDFEANGDYDIVGWYYEIEGVDKTLKNYAALTVVELDKRDLPDEGVLYNFDYIEMRDQNGNPINVPNIYSYEGGITRNDVAPFDIETYGHYMQRAVADKPWGPIYLGTINHITSAGTRNASVIYDPQEQVFKGSLFLDSGLSDRSISAGSETDWSYLVGNYPEAHWRKRHTLNYLLPKGMIPTSTEEGVTSSVGDPKVIYAGDDEALRNPETGELWAADRPDLYRKISDRTRVTYLRNWHGTGQYMVRVDVDLSDAPLTGYSSWLRNYFSFKLDYMIPLEAYEEYGQEYTVKSFADGQELNIVFDRDTDSVRTNYITDDGTGHFDDGVDDDDYVSIVDIDDDGDTSEYIRESDLSIRVAQATSTSQTIHATARGDVDDVYTAQDVITSAGGNYSYKLRLSTGDNRNSNVVLYDNLEQDYENNEYWQGEFRSVDVSKAEEQLDRDGNPIQIEVYYSEDARAGSLSDDNSWQAYDDSVDKTKVRSLAFKYLNQNNEPAILPEFHSSYVLINMQAPDENTYDTFAYNSFRSEWNALDNSGQIIAGISGLNSNITAVQIDNPFDITVINEWIDGGNAYRTRPNSIDFSLLFGGRQTDHRELATTNDVDSFVFANLHIYDEDHHDVTLPAITGYTTDRNYDPDTHTYTFRHTLNATYVVNVEQIWVDNDNSFELRPESNGYILRKPGADDQTSTIDFTSDETANSFTTSFTDLPLADRANTALVKPEYDFYNTAMSCDDGENYAVNCTVTSTLEFVSIKVKHIWDDDDNALGARPDELFSDLLHGEDPVLGHDISTTDAEDEFTIVTIPKVLLSEFSVRIEPFAFYDTTVEHDEETNTYIFTSTLKPAAIHVQNVWVDNDNARKLRPESLVFKLNYNDAEEVSHTISTADNNTSFDFDNLFEFKADGYKVVLSEAVADYETAIDYDAETRTFIFVHTLTAKEEPENTEEPTVKPTEPEKPAENKESGLPNTESVNPIPFILALFAFGAGASISAAIAIRRRS